VFGCLRIARVRRAVLTTRHLATNVTENAQDIHHHHCHHQIAINKHHLSVNRTHTTNRKKA
jgi:hypothetical protein